jgi:hypothetical protein
VSTSTSAVDALLAGCCLSHEAMQRGISQLTWAQDSVIIQRWPCCAVKVHNIRA